MDKWNVKAQGALEFMILVGITLLVFALIIGIAAYYTASIGQKKQARAAEDIAIAAQKEIQLAARVHDGYERTFTLPDKAAGRDYNISIQQNELIVTIAGSDTVRIVPSAQGSIKKGKNTVTKYNGIIAFT